MVNVDLSKILPVHTYERLAAFLPGFFFLFSVTLAKPELSSRILTSLQQSPALSRYALAFMGVAGVFLAFVIGSGFILVDTFIQYVLGYAYELKMFAYRQLCKWPIRQITQWLLTKPKLRGPFLGNLHTRAANIAVAGFEDWRKFQACWFVLARRLLKVRYGIESKDLKDDEWEVLYSNLGTETAEEMRGLTMMIALHACGWAGLVAERIAPILQSRYYVGFCFFLIANGLLHDYYVVVRRFDPRVAGNLNVRAVLREFPKTEGASKPSLSPEQGE